MRLNNPNTRLGLSSAMSAYVCEVRPQHSGKEVRLHFADCSARMRRQPDVYSLAPYTASDVLPRRTRVLLTCER